MIIKIRAKTGYKSNEEYFVVTAGDEAVFAINSQSLTAILVDLNLTEEQVYETWSKLDEVFEVVINKVG